MNKIILNIENLDDNNGFNCYIKGRSYDLEENNCNKDDEKAVYYYKKGYYEYDDLFCKYSLAISNYLGDFKDLLDDKDRSITFPNIEEFKKLIKEDSIKYLYAKFITAAYYNYGLSNVKKDSDKAFEIIYECAKKGHVGAMYDLGAKEKFKCKVDVPEKYLNQASICGSLRAKKILEEKITKVFVYGTLKSDKIQKALFGKVLNKHKAILKNYGLYEASDGFYFVKEELNKNISGYIIELNMYDLIVSDMFEYCPLMYERRKVKVLSNEKSVECDIYYRVDDVGNYKYVEDYNSYSKLSEEEFINTEVKDFKKEYSKLYVL